MPTTPFTTQEIRKAAALYCEGAAEWDIAAALGSRDEQEVRQMIERALLDKLLRFEPVLAIDDMDADLAEFIYNTTLMQRIIAALKRTIPLLNVELTVTRSPLGMFEHYVPGADPSDPAYRQYMTAEAASMRMIAHRAALELSARLFDGNPHAIGCNYGASVYSVLRNVTPMPAQVTQPITVVSLFGDLDFATPDAGLPLFQHGAPIASNDLVAMLAGRIGPAARAERLTAPLFIPHDFAVNSLLSDGIRRFITGHASYQRIFGDTDRRDGQGGGLISKLDTIVTGFGSADNYTVLHRFLTSLLSEREREDLVHYSSEGRVAGDLGGHFIPSHDEMRHGSTVTAFLAGINARLVAATPRDFVEVARRHTLRPESGAGVVGIAAGARKARILHTLLLSESCPISRLCIDTHCALALLHLLDEYGFREFVAAKDFTAAYAPERWSDGSTSAIPFDR